VNLRTYKTWCIYWACGNKRP